MHRAHPIAWVTAGAWNQNVRKNVARMTARDGTTPDARNVGSRQEPAVEGSSARASGTTPSSVHQVSGGVQRVTSPQKAASHIGDEDSDDEEWYSDDEDDGIAKHNVLTESDLSANVSI